MTRLLILGSTGPSGLELVRTALNDIPDVQLVLYVRSPQKLPEEIKSNPAVTVVEGTLEDTAALERALEGVDAILSALGATGPSHPKNTPIAKFYSRLMKLMRERGIKRFLVLATPSAPDPENDRFSFGYKAMVLSIYLLINPAYKECHTLGEMLRGPEGKDIEWTMVRVPYLSHEDRTDTVAGYVGDRRLGLKLSRKGFAQFMVDELKNRQWVRKMPVVSNA
ncbi:NAD(P)-binding protein [Schizophyllum commune H4-8]|uniref:NAD(P)-binding domain-containing protein n=1 Tax=Schizophyllum commune (strain H4-8 / FGSC 9210) TaxID=578458 RepID=D8PUG8_SCHCM|nr:NAD(P)-binding protein [Schizophyllum commune H4-8]KAI5900686.1 NAD(P)-binding protein [Schizophyllum commune H4-8]